jgi:hypothetical protein
MKKVFFILGIVSLFGMSSCTENSRVKNWGGEGTLTLPKGQKLVNVTWKESQIWYLTRSMKETDSAEVYTFHEESSYGMMEGTYKIVEVK